MSENVLKQFTIQESLNFLGGALRIIQAKVIGFFRHPGSNTDEMVVEEDEHTFTTIHVGSFLGLQTTIFPKSKFQFIPFPGNKTLSDMMEDPLGFDYWYKNLWS